MMANLSGEEDGWEVHLAQASSQSTPTSMGAKEQGSKETSPSPYAQSTAHSSDGDSEQDVDQVRPAHEAGLYSRKLCVQRAHNS